VVKQFVILSAGDAGRGEALGETARRFGADAEWGSPDAIRFPGPTFRELIVWGRDEADVLDAERGAAGILLGLGAFDQSGRRLTPRALRERVATSGLDTLAEVAAPQSVVLAFGDPLQLAAATDHVGLSAVYHCDHGGAQAVGSSSRQLAAILGCPLDDDAIGAFAVLGEYAATDTPFRGVRRLAAGECATLGERGLTVARYCAPAAPADGARDEETAVRQGVEAVRAGVDACLAAYPDMTMELSGGLDSRVILAAVLTAGQRPTEAMTLGLPTHPDVVVAARLAAQAGIPHRRIDLSAMADLTRSDALRLVDQAGRRRDYSGNCVALGVLEWVEELTGSEPRLSGQNGELARGFYYPFQPPWPRTADALARALVRWRLMANERVSGELLVPEAAAGGERRAAQTTQALLERAGCDWLRATDMLYLNWRMQRWVGGDWSAAAQTRIVLAPFFHPRYIGWALSASPRFKRGSKLLARVLHAIDPELARLPIAGGDPPVAIFNPRPADRVSHAARTARKVVVKVRQRLTDAASPPVGAPVLADLALNAMADERVGLERVAALPFVSAEYVERVAETRQASPATAGLLAALRGLASNGA
jgi:asparagine synthase (glutamine-hydrolysing)